MLGAREACCGDICPHGDAEQSGAFLKGRVGLKRNQIGEGVAVASPAVGIGFAKCGGFLVGNFSSLKSIPCSSTTVWRVMVMGGAYTDGAVAPNPISLGLLLALTRLAQNKLVCGSAGRAAGMGAPIFS